mmetsp:Transcript_71671/g.135178  ORF Transcript_71671/g.135178 Transcript_71671/m.135178 type:complete len:300 (+) Transcript_71671:3-902(+)
MLDLRKVPYEVRSLPVGDFLFQVNHHPHAHGGSFGSGGVTAEWAQGQARAAEAKGQCSVLPVVVERKAAADVALSLKDGRWASQQKVMSEASRSQTFAGTMRQGQSVLQRVELVYLVEGSLSKARAGCSCGKVCLAFCGGPTLSEANDAIQALGGGGYTVVRTTGLAQTAAVLEAKVRALALCLATASPSPSLLPSSSPPPPVPAAAAAAAVPPTRGEATLPTTEVLAEKARVAVGWTWCARFTTVSCKAARPQQRRSLWRCGGESLLRARERSTIFCRKVSNLQVQLHLRLKLTSPAR